MKMYTQDWFTHNIPYWDVIVEKYVPAKILEIGSFEGRSACYLIEELAIAHPIEIYCVDTWQGGEEHATLDMKMHEMNFNHNIVDSIQLVRNQAKVYKRKGLSIVELSRLIVEGMSESFDVVYVDGSHQASHVFADAALSFNLLRVGGVLIFDDYKYLKGKEQFDKERFSHPRIAIDSFIACHANKLRHIRFETVDNDPKHKPYQMYLEKSAI